MIVLSKYSLLQTFFSVSIVISSCQRSFSFTTTTTAGFSLVERRRIGGHIPWNNNRNGKRQSPPFISAPVDTTTALFYSRNQDANNHDRDDKNNKNNDNRESEFTSLEPRSDHHKFQTRMQKEQSIQDQFVPYGQELWDLRDKITDLSMKLIDSYSDDDIDTDLVREELREAERLDPFLVYGQKLSEMELALKEGKEDDAVRFRREAMSARSCVPQFNFEGLWIGK